MNIQRLEELARKEAAECYWWPAVEQQKFVRTIVSLAKTVDAYGEGAMLGDEKRERLAVKLAAVCWMDAKRFGREGGT